MLKSEIKIASGASKIRLPTCVEIFESLNMVERHRENRIIPKPNNNRMMKKTKTSLG